MRALVIGDDTRSFLAVVRSLGRAGWEVDAAPFDFSSAALRSHYLRRIHRLPPHSLSAERWVERLRALIETEHYDLILPCDDRGLIPLQGHAGELGDVPLALPNDEAMAVFFDKDETRRLAAALDIPVAPGRLLARDDKAADLAAMFGLPLALKPRASYTLGQAGAKASVRIVRSAEALAQALAGIRERGHWLVEGFFRGEGVGLSVLADRGEIRLAFQHRRLHEASETGGSSSRIGEAVDPRLLQAVGAMARATRLHGVAMFEFRRAGADFILLEVNCRFWGSLPLAVASGVDFPAAAAALHTGRALPASAGGYRPGLVLKDLGGEYYRILRRASAAGALPIKALRAAAGLATLALALPFGRRFDSFAADDPAPWQRQRAQLLRGVSTALVKRLPLLDRRRRGSRAALRRLARNLAEGRRGVIMLCHGNICRSPFAEHRLREKAGAAGLDLSVISAGTIGLEGRSSPEDALAVARRWGTDLSGHRSRFLDVEDALAAGAVIVFDDKNVDELRRLGLNGDINLLRLAHLTGQREIGDPYGHGPDGFADAYGKIDRAVDTLVAGLVREAAR
ncbi:arsenate reductase/protein-tyrosine-phosphatase family protein [Sphingomonas parva]|nr:ATP-grasp domain-containing protein [Sphingomonas parva]